MAEQAQIVQTGQGWFVETLQGRFGPMDTRQEAANYLKLMQLADAAGTDTACTEADCLV